jgi:hypothetical protein
MSYLVKYHHLIMMILLLFTHKPRSRMLPPASPIHHPTQTHHALAHTHTTTAPHRQPRVQHAHQTTHTCMCVVGVANGPHRQPVMIEVPEVDHLKGHLQERMEGEKLSG